MIEYIKDKYGVDNVCTVIAEGTMACNAVVRRVLSAYDYENAYINRICKSIPDVLGITLEQAYEASEAFKAYMNKHSAEYKIMMSLEGTMCYTSKHAAGVVITSKPLEDYIPLMRDEDDHSMPKSQWDKYKLEKVGAQKFDFLGLKTLTVIKKTLEAVKRNYNIDIDLEKIDLEDNCIYELLNSGDLHGIFQFSEHSGKQIIERIKPTCFNDITAGNALCRPGVKERDLYVNNKTNGYDLFGNDIIDNVLKDTYGAIVYQEQTMLLMNRLTGGRWTLGKADKMRKVKSLEEYRDDFISCCELNGISKELGNSIFDRFDLGYSFNLSHAVCYSVISAQTAWLKAKYRKEFMAAVMTMEKDKTDNELASQIKECKKYGIKILPPDINNSSDEFVAVQEGILYPLTAIMNVGEVAVKEIMSKRPYSSFSDLCSKVSSKVNKKVKSNLIKVGAFDSISDINRNLLLEQHTEERQLTWCKDVQQRYERELLGFTLTSHPMEDYNCVPLKSYEDNTIISVPAILTGIRVIKDRNSNDMAFAKFENSIEEFEGVIFSFSYGKFKDILVENMKLMVTGKKEGNKILVNELRCL
jgi:DNA polymerase-3 subunit alpha